MKVIRTFHPVGQGAFYSERFYKDGDSHACHNIIFDCGVQWGYKKKTKQSVAQAFDQSDTIDYLFLSHLDYDHISLIDILETHVKSIKRIVLPLVAEEDLVIAMAMNDVSGYPWISRFFQRLIDHLHGRRTDTNEDKQYEVIFVGNSEDESKARIWQNGKSEPLLWLPEWILIPYNKEYQSRKPELIKKFDGMLRKVDFVTELKTVGYEFIQTGDDLYDKLKDSVFVNTILANTKLKCYVKNAYEKLCGGINRNSLLLYSGPWQEESMFIHTMTRPFYPSGCPYLSSRAGCLFTGDCDADIQGWSTGKFSKVWDFVGTIQLPHHGSLDSFDVAKNPINERKYLFPVSCGTYNTYGHPSGKVLAYLMANNCYPHIVTEDVNSVLIMEFEKI